MGMHNIKKNFFSTMKGFLFNLPMLLSVILLSGLFTQFVSAQSLLLLFSGQPVYDTFIGTISGGLSVGQPFVSYIIGGEMLAGGVSHYAVTAFILSWVTLGVLQLPYEYALFGKRFTLLRNLLAFVFTLLVAFATVQSINLLCS